MSNIHQTAIIDASALIHDSVKIGPYSVIGPDVSIAEKCELKSHVVLKGPSNIGPGNKFFSFCVIGEDTPDLKYKEKNLFPGPILLGIQKSVTTI